MNALKFTPFPTLLTERLTLRKFSAGDKKNVFIFRSDDRIMKYIKRPKQQHPDEASAFISMINNGIEENKWINWVITLTETSQFIGTICLWKFAEGNTVAEVGYALHPDFQGKGIMTEALNCVIAYGFDSLKLKSVDAYTNRNNAKSIALLERKGFIHQPEKTDEGNLENAIYILYNPSGTT